MKINIVLEIYINSSASADKREDTEDINTFQNCIKKSNFSF